MPYVPFTTAENHLPLPSAISMRGMEHWANTTPAPNGISGETVALKLSLRPGNDLHPQKPNFIAYQESINLQIL